MRVLNGLRIRTGGSRISAGTIRRSGSLQIQESTLIQLYSVGLQNQCNLHKIANQIRHEAWGTNYNGEKRNEALPAIIHLHRFSIYKS
jgi:hypothetical protein